MPRPPRLVFAGATYHVTGRGNNGERIFNDDADRYAYLVLLAKTMRVMAARLFAYALMSNHVHLVLQTTAANISATIHRLHGPYAAYYNRQHGRNGHLFGRRFYSELVEEDAYLLELTRYVHLNPVRAGLAAHPKDYPWTSYGLYMSHSNQSLVDIGVILELLGSDLSRSRMAYATFVDGEITSKQTGGVSSEATYSPAAVVTKPPHRLGLSSIARRAAARPEDRAGRRPGS